MSSCPCVAVFNANNDLVELLRIALENGGFVAVSARLDSIRRAEVNLEQFVRQHRPSVIVYDVAPPYERQWTFLQHLRSLPSLANLHFVVTSTNPTRLRELVGTDEQIYEIVGKPYDLEQIIAAVKRAM